MTYKDNITCFLVVLLFFFFAGSALAQQSRSYELLPYPDVWYNDIDGIRVGGRVIGQVPGTFKDGPHRLNAGLWLSTWFPDYPVSYNVQFVEPIPSISEFNSETNIELGSTVRTGIYRHSVTFNKRWQRGYNEFQYIRLSAGLMAQKRFEDAYTHYPALWQDKRLWLGSIHFELQNTNSLGRYKIESSLHGNLFGDAPGFGQVSSSFRQRITLSSEFALRARLAAGLANENSATEFLFGRSFAPANKWLESSLVRAKGTIPTNWFESGIFQVSGSANLRGYSHQDISALENGQLPLLSSFGALNLELDYPNPIDGAIQKIPVVGNLLKLRSYLFLDSGTSLGITELEESRVLSDAGVGFMFSFNIPDYLGNPRGIMLRYDLPLWLSNPGQENHLKYRNVVGIGAIFTF